MSASRSRSAGALAAQFLFLVLAGCGGVPPDTRERPAPIVNADPTPIPKTTPKPVPKAIPTPAPVSRPTPTPTAMPEPEPEPVQPPSPSTLPPPDSNFEQSKRLQAEELMQSGRLAEAADQWEILTLLRPARAEYASKLTEARSRATKQASDSLVAAGEARKRGDLQRATTLYLKALSAEPHNAAAIQALRELDREQSHRAYFNHATLGTGGARATRAPRAPYSSDRQEIDAAVLLLHQGDFDASLQTVQNYLKRYPNDDMGKRTLRDAYAALGKQRIEQGKKEEGVRYLEKARAIKSAGSADLDSTVQAARKDLAQDYYEQGLRMQRTDLGAAIRLWERSLEYDPRHAQARLQVEQAQRVQRSLKSIPEVNSTP